jgi:hypothetical protein
VSQESDDEATPDARAGLYRLWAIASSVLCAGLVAYILVSKTSESPRVVVALPPASAPNQNSSTDPTFAGEPAAQPTLPTVLRGLTKEWISAGEDRDGKAYAALIDFDQRREVILERCQHEGYFDDERGEPLKAGWQCARALAGSISSVEGGQMSLVASTGANIRIGVARTGPPREPHLELSIGDERIDLVPGSKNDLLQRFEQTFAVASSKERSIQYELGRIEEARRDAEELGK